MPNRKHGFTLIELAIVMVIIGLLVGGVLVGRDMIRAGEVQEQVSQLTQFNAAVNTFRDQYMGLPGDLMAPTAIGYGMAARDGSSGHGDGNNRIEGCSPNAKKAGCETLNFWSDLSFAQLIKGSYAGTDSVAAMAMISPPQQPQLQQFADLMGTVLDRLNPIADAHAGFASGPVCNCNYVCPGISLMRTERCVAGACPGPTNCPVTVGTKADMLPQAPIGSGNYVTVFTDGDTNFYQISGIVSTNNAGDYTLSDRIKPIDALAYDKKIDDGQPLSGTVQAVGGTTTLGTAAVAGAGNCVSNAGGAPYNTATGTLADSQLCQLQVRM